MYYRKFICNVRTPNSNTKARKNLLGVEVSFENKNHKQCCHMLHKWILNNFCMLTVFYWFGIVDMLFVCATCDELLGWRHRRNHWASGFGALPFWMRCKVLLQGKGGTLVGCFVKYRNRSKWWKRSVQLYRSGWKTQPKASDVMLILSNISLCDNLV